MLPAKYGDNSNAFVKADKEEDFEIYVQVPRGMSVADKSLKDIGARSTRELVLQLRRSMYELNQAGCLWYSCYTRDLLRQILLSV